MKIHSSNFCAMINVVSLQSGRQDQPSIVEHRNGQLIWQNHCAISCAFKGQEYVFFLGCKHLHCSVFVAISGKVELWPPITTNMCSIYLLDLNLQFFLGPTAKSHKYIVDPASEVPLTVFSGGNNTSLLLNSEQHCHPHVSSACLQAI